jgi:hypothetical protein
MLFQGKLTKEIKDIETLAHAQKKKNGKIARPNTPSQTLPLER